MSKMAVIAEFIDINSCPPQCRIIMNHFTSSGSENSIFCISATVSHSPSISLASSEIRSVMALQRLMNLSSRAETVKQGKNRSEYR